MDNNSSQQDDVLTAEIQDENESSDSTNATQNQATVILSLEDLIKNHVGSIDKISVELKQQQEMINGVMLNDETHRLQEEAVKEATKVRNITRSEILKRPDVASTSNKVKELKADLKDQKTTLSDLLQEYQRASGNNEIEVDGTLLRIVSNSKLAKRS